MKKPDDAVFRILKFNHAAKIVRFILTSNIKDASTVITNTQSKGWSSSSVATLSTTPNSTKKYSATPSVTSNRTSAYSPQGPKMRGVPTEVAHARRNMNKAHFPGGASSGNSPYGSAGMYAGSAYMSTDSYDDYQSHMSLSPGRGGTGMTMHAGGYSDPYEAGAVLPPAVPMMAPPVYAVPAAQYYVAAGQPQVVYAAYGQPAAMQAQQLMMQQQQYQHQQMLAQQQQQQMQYMYYAQGMQAPGRVEADPTAAEAPGVGVSQTPPVQK
jgi:hypothetical protein